MQLLYFSVESLYLLLLIVLVVFFVGFFILVGTQDGLLLSLKSLLEVSEASQIVVVGFLLSLGEFELELRLDFLNFFILLVCCFFQYFLSFFLVGLFHFYLKFDQVFLQLDLLQLPESL